MTITLWRVLDHPVVDACLGSALWLVGLTIAVILLPQGSGLEAMAEFWAFWATVVVIWKLVAALVARLRASG